MSIKLMMNILKRKWLGTYLLPKRYLCNTSEECTESVCLVGRDFISPEDFTSNELKTLLWSAFDFKNSKTSNTSKFLQDICNCNATVIMKKPHINSQLSITNALSSLGCAANFVIDDCWDASNTIDLGRALTRLTNVIVTVDANHESVEELRDGASIPVINFNSSSFQMVECLANVMSVHEHYGFLKNLKICWIGPANAALNTYIFMSSKFQMNVQFLIACDENEENKSLDLLNCAIKYAIKGGAQIKKCLEVEEAIYRAHVITTTKHSSSEFKITEKLLCEAAVNWILLHHLPRSNKEVSCEVFLSNNNLVWDAFENQKWIFMAIVAHLLKGHEPSCERPDFEGNNASAEEFYQS